MKRTVVCNCEHRFDAEFPERVELLRNPEMEEAILKGSFMTTKCPKCGKLLKMEFPTRFLDDERGLDLFLVPEENRREYMKGTAAYVPADVRRVVIGYEELVEKLMLIRHELDERCIEVIKYYLLNRALSEYEDPADRVYILLAAQEKDILTFHLHGLKQGEVAVVRVPYEKYEHVEQQVEEKMSQDPFKWLLAPPYVSINNLYRSEPLKEER